MTKTRQRSTMDGLPLRDGRRKFSIVLMPKDFKDAAPRDGDACAIALGCQRQLSAPFVHITRTMAYIATPSERGVELTNWPGKWVMERYTLSTASKKAVVAVDTGQTITDPLIVEVRPVQPKDRLGTRSPQRMLGGAHARNRGLRPNPLTAQGVRDYTGRLPA